MSKPLKFYFDLMSQPSRALYICLELAKIPHTKVPVALRKGEHLTEDFKAKINRFQKVPAIADDDFKLSESIAILRYLDGKKEYPGLKEYYPSDVKQRALVDEFLEWQHNNIRAFCAMYFQTVWLIPILTGKPANPSRVEANKERMEGVLDLMENIWLAEGNKFITGSKLTAADIWAAAEIEQPKMAGYDPCVGRPKLEAWLKEVKALTNPVYDEAHKVVYKISQSGQSKL